MKIVVSLGGSLLTKELTPEHFKKYVDVFTGLFKSGHRLVVVCGGGRVCRDYQNIARTLGADREQLDFIGIMSTHLNASTLCYCMDGLGYLVKWKPLDGTLKEVKGAFAEKIVVAAGYDVGTSTDYDAAHFAEIVDADLLINATNVDGVYDKDPKANPGAKKIPKMGYNDFIKIIKMNEQAPGEYRLFDLRAAETVRRMRLKTVIIDGTDPREIERAVKGVYSGTEIS